MLYNVYSFKTPTSSKFSHRKLPVELVPRKYAIEALGVTLRESDQPTFRAIRQQKVGARYKVCKNRTDRVACARGIRTMLGVTQNRPFTVTTKWRPPKDEDVKWSLFKDYFATFPERKPDHQYNDSFISRQIQVPTGVSKEFPISVNRLTGKIIVK